MFKKILIANRGDFGPSASGAGTSAQREGVGGKSLHHAPTPSPSPEGEGR
jgi:hypothetical protein